MDGLLEAKIEPKWKFSFKNGPAAGDRNLFLM